MSAGLPGLGLSGLFVLLSTLVLPIAHQTRSRTRSTHRIRIASLFAISATITAAAVWSWYLIAFLVHTSQSAHGKHSTASGEIFGLPVIVVSLGILAALLVIPEVLLHLIGTRPTPPVPPVENRRGQPRRVADRVPR